LYTNCSVHTQNETAFYSLINFVTEGVICEEFVMLA